LLAGVALLTALVALVLAGHQRFREPVEAEARVCQTGRRVFQSGY
jgi:hypothetical protein